jgi:23S rRNA pseudouridine2605 synthase
MSDEFPDGGERIAKYLARAGVGSRRECERLIEQGIVTVEGKVLDTPAFKVTGTEDIRVDGARVGGKEKTRLFRYYKPVGLVTTHKDPEGRPTVFDALPPGLPRLISVGRLDLNTEGLLLLTNDGELARHLELPSTGWVRRYRVRVYGYVTQARLDTLAKGIEVEGLKYGPITAKLDSTKGHNSWLTVSFREGKNREIRRVMESLDLKVNRLIRLSYGPFQLGGLKDGEVEEVTPKAMEELLGKKWIKGGAVK